MFGTDIGTIKITFRKLSKILKNRPISKLSRSYETAAIDALFREQKIC